MKELQTGRLLLRRLRREDVPRIFSCWASDPAVTKYLTWQPHESEETTHKIMDLWLAAYDKPETRRYGIELKDSGELIGMIDVVQIANGEPVIGYCSGRAYWGNGYMTEALRALCDALFEEGYPSIYIEAVDENTGSNRVIQKAGFSFVGSRVHTPPAGEKSPVTLNCYRLKRA
ncbi:MAG: GNAT family N-acetyltransferase [Oscillospiraceae bacterium]|nr:GNAT family N-acetyltransferase [Oscillospiraceae bacterium]